MMDFLEMIMLAMIIFPYVNLKFIVVSVFAFDEFNYRYAKKDCKCFFKIFCRDESPRNKSEIVEGVP